MDYIENGSRASYHALVSMFLGSLVTFAVLYCPQPLISVFSEQYQVSPSTASFTISLSTAALALCMLIIPLFANSWGRKRMMSISLFVTSLLTTLTSFIDSFQILLVIRFLIGFSLSGFLASAMTYLNEEFSPKSIGKVVGVYIAGTAAGGVFGRVIVGALTDLFSWKVAMLALGIISLLCSVWFWLFLPEPKNFTRVNISFSNWKLNIKKSLSSKGLWSLYSIGFLLIGVYVTLLNYIGYPLTKEPYQLNQTLLGFLFLVTLSGTYSSVLFGKLADKFPRIQVMSWAVALTMIGALLTLNSVLFIKVFGITLFAFGFFAGHTIASGWVGILAPKENKAQASSMYLLFYYSGSSMIGWAGGLFWSYFDWGGLIGMICILLGIAIILTFKVNEKNTIIIESAPVKNL